MLSFLCGRTAQVVLHGVSSRVRSITRGATQWTVLGPLLFMLYIDPVVPLLRTVARVDPVLYADDITLLTTGRTAADCANTTQPAVDLLHRWCDDNGMPISPCKTQAPLFTPSHNSDEDNLGIHLGALLVLLSRQTPCKLLGVHLDAGLFFGRHLALIRARATAQLRLLRHAVTQVGPTAHTLRIFGRALVESRLFYAVGGWGSQLSEYEQGCLESTQRELARAVTGLVGQSPPAATLLEANLVPASVLTRTRVAALLERWRRLLTSDLRCALVDRPLPHGRTSPISRKSRWADLTCTDRTLCPPEAPPHSGPAGPPLSPARCGRRLPGHHPTGGGGGTPCPTPKGD